jgi:hypothetical protein
MVYKHLCSAEQKRDSGAVAEVVLPVVQSVRNCCHEVLGLQRAQRCVLGYFEVNSAAGRHRKLVLPSEILDPGARCYPSKKNLSERCNPGAPEVYLGPKRYGIAAPLLLELELVAQTPLTPPKTPSRLFTL